MNQINSPAIEAIKQLKSYLGQHIIGQDDLINRMLIALLSDGHILVEGAPGLAKTRAINCLSQGIETNFHRVQFTPDLLPADLTGTEIYRPQTSSFEFQKGPLFHNLVLADEMFKNGFYHRAYSTYYYSALQLMKARLIYEMGYDDDFFKGKGSHDKISVSIFAKYLFRFSICNKLF
jgi:hypothetical protein